MQDSSTSIYKEELNVPLKAMKLLFLSKSLRSCQLAVIMEPKNQKCSRRSAA